MYHEFLVDHRNELVQPDVPLCENSVIMLKNIIGATFDIGIVWSTDWRFEERETYDGWRNPRLWLEQQDWFSNVLIGKTPMKMSSNRFEEIHFWFTENHYREQHSEKAFMKDYAQNKTFLKDDFYNVKNYAILDDFDSPGMKMYGNHFFRTDPSIGLDQRLAENVISFLKNDDFDYDDLDWSHRE